MAEPDPLFELFCAYHLGLFPDGTVKFGNIHDVARAFGLGPDEVIPRLAEHELDPDSLVHSGFDVASAQADVQVSPEGVDLVVLARMHFDAALEARSKPRDWASELSEDEEKNRALFGASGRDRDDD